MFFILVLPSIVTTILLPTDSGDQITQFCFQLGGISGFIVFSLILLIFATFQINLIQISSGFEIYIICISIIAFIAFSIYLFQYFYLPTVKRVVVVCIANFYLAVWSAFFGFFLLSLGRLT